MRKVTKRPPLAVGEVVTIEGMAGTVVADITHGLYSPEFTEAEWSYLGQGFLWLCEAQAGLVHWDDNTRVEQLGQKRKPR